MITEFSPVASLTSVSLDEDVILISDNGIIIRIEASTVRQCSRPSKGVKVMRLVGKGKVVAVACVPHEEPEKEESDEEENLETQD